MLCNGEIQDKVAAHPTPLGPSQLERTMSRGRVDWGRHGEERQGMNLACSESTKIA